MRLAGQRGETRKRRPGLEVSGEMKIGEVKRTTRRPPPLDRGTRDFVYFEGFLASRERRKGSLEWINWRRGDGDFLRLCLQV